MQLARHCTPLDIHKYFQCVAHIVWLSPCRHVRANFLFLSEMRHARRAIMTSAGDPAITGGPGLYCLKRGALSSGGFEQYPNRARQRNRDRRQALGGNKSNLIPGKEVRFDKHIMRSH